MTTLQDLTNTLKHEKPSTKQSQTRASQQNVSQRGSRLQSQNDQVGNENQLGSRGIGQERQSQNGGSRAAAQSRTTQVGNPQNNSQAGSRGLVQNRDGTGTGLAQPFIVPTPKTRQSNARISPDKGQTRDGPTRGSQRTRQTGVGVTRGSQVQTRQGVTRGSQVSGRTQAGPTRGSKTSRRSGIEEEEDEEDDDDDYYDEDDDDSVHYYPDWIPDEATDDPYRPRVETSDGYEACSCFPNRTSKNVSSMLYENVKCVHTGLQGQTHAGVFRFDDNWIDDYENLRSREMSPPRMKFVLGYPKPVFVNDDSDDESNVNDKRVYDDDEDDDYDNDNGKTPKSRSKTKNSKKAKTAPRSENNKTRAKSEKSTTKDKQNKTDEMDYDDDDDDYEDMELTREDRYYPLVLPQIGHSPPPSRGNSRLSARSVPALPPLPESPFLTTEKAGSASRQSYTQNSGRHSAPLNNRSPVAKREINKNRRFQGKYYDPVTKKSVDYDITPMFRHRSKDLDSPNDGRSRMSSRMPERLSNFRRNSSVGIPEEDDDVY